ncbi:hypothetical protein SAMN05216252_107411 [Actinacidiphila glaucinigra]|uniref:DUF3592 domain-containing protein n=1 Tax=Actinacidiphila glaucinigra TaxID=235986 RepID=A0A239GIE3_9ACTN|nr:hypothetical protein SAMN05216252_107411 [Actinacidiphila glaucinigra]
MMCPVDCASQGAATRCDEVVECPDGTPRVNLVLGALFLVVGACLLTPAVMSTVELRDGVHTTGTVRTQLQGADDDRLWVTFTVANAEVTYRLPSTTDRRLLDDGDRLAVVYRPDRPDTVTAERDIGGTRLFVSSGMAALGLGLMAFAAVELRQEGRRRVRSDAEPSGSAG